MTPKSVVETRTTCITSILSTQPIFQKHKKQANLKKKTNTQTHTQLQPTEVKTKNTEKYFRYYLGVLFDIL